MNDIFSGVFSEYAVKRVGIRPDGESDYTIMDGAGTLNDEFEMHTIVKKKSNITKWQRTRYTGEGTLAVTCHIPLTLLRTISGRASTGVTGVYGLDTSAVIVSSEVVVEVEDEDGDIYYKYYPSASLSKNASEIDSNSDEVAEADLEFALSADTNGLPVYDSLSSELDSSLDWMTDASSDNLYAATA